MSTLQKLMCLLILLFSFISTSGVAQFSLPSPNTSSNISFRDFEWYADYNTIKEKAKKKGFSKGHDQFYGYNWDAPHWNGARTEIGNCGGNIIYFTAPDVAGHPVYSASLYFITSPEKGGMKKYKNKGVSSFYMATYIIKIDKDPDCYVDLALKLRRIYGETPVEKTYFDELRQICWVNQENAAILLAETAFGDVSLTYIAPDAEKRLTDVEQYLLEQDLINNPAINAPDDDLTGL